MARRRAPKPPAPTVLWEGYVALREDADGGIYPDKFTLTTVEERTHTLAWEADDRAFKRTLSADRAKLKRYLKVVGVKLVTQEEVPHA